MINEILRIWKDSSEFVEFHEFAILWMIKGEKIKNILNADELKQIKKIFKDAPEFVNLGDLKGHTKKEVLEIIADNVDIIKTPVLKILNIRFNYYDLTDTEKLEKLKNELKNI